MDSVFQKPTSNNGNNNSNPPLRVGSGLYQIEKQIAEGGFARVYLSRRVPDGVQVAIKHIVMPPDAKIQRVLLSEVEIMKTLKHKNIVQYFDSNITGKEIFIAMKYCPYSLVQAMNSKMQTKFSEQEVLKIMKETTEAVLYLHYLQPPIVHRDIKVENILICQNGREPVFKLCDFGSCTTRIIPPRTTLSSSEISALEDELERQTTLAYRAPEMLDLYRKRGLTEKTDVWAMGVFLYKLCYFVTPFEADGKMAILNHSYVHPQNIRVSEGIKSFIDWLLSEEPSRRPNIYRVLERVCQLKGEQIPEGIQNKYQETERMEAKEEEDQDSVPLFAPTNAAPSQGLKLSPPVAQRRGRIQKGHSATPSANSADVFSVTSSGANSQQNVFDTLKAFPSNDVDPFATSTAPVIETQSSALFDDAFGIAATNQNSTTNQIPSSPSNLISLNPPAPSQTSSIMGSSAAELFEAFSAPPRVEVNSRSSSVSSGPSQRTATGTSGFQLNQFGDPMNPLQAQTSKGRISVSSIQSNGSTSLGFAGVSSLYQTPQLSPYGYTANQPQMMAGPMYQTYQGQASPQLNPIYTAQNNQMIGRSPRTSGASSLVATTLGSRPGSSFSVQTPNVPKKDSIFP